MGYDLHEVLDEDGDRTLLRGRRRDDDAAVLVTWVAADDPGAADRLRRAAELAQQVASPTGPRGAGGPVLEGAAPPLAHGRGDGGSYLVYPDPGGVPLSQLLADGPLPVAVTLEVALQLSAALGRVHAAGVLHRDVRPAHVLVDLAGRRAALIGAHAAAPADSTAPLAIAAAALPYVAPEMTGRTSQACDYRSDYYSLGATLYHALTGQPPFHDDDPMRVIHGHIARAPVPPATVRPELPRALSRIALKLLAKQPGDRYQSSRGLGRDLIRCLREFTDRGAIDDFTPGLEDTSERLRLPDALYGRDVPLGDLQALFARAAAGEVALALVTGPSGVGKSAVVRAARERVVAGGGRIAAGACTRFHQTAPFHVLAEALREFFAHALVGPGRALHYWRELLLAALAGEGALLTDIIPGLLPVLGPQPAVAPLPPVERANRFRHVLRRLLTALARPQHPLVVVLDDLQWCDPATLQLLGDLLTADDLHHLLVLATLRDGEEPGNPPMTAVLAELTASGRTVCRLPLAPLGRADIDAWLTAALRPCPQDLSGLVDMVTTSTGGNPFLARLLVQSLHEQQVIRFDPEQGVWQWRVGQTAAARIPDGIGALVSQRIDQLSAPARAALTTAACIGPRFELALLAALLRVPSGSAAAAIREAEARGLVLPAADDDDRSRLVYCFLHPRVHQAAYAALPPSRTPALHLAIGRALAELPDDLGFEVIGHLNLGAALITDPAERADLARRNLDAARRSLAATAWDSAARYARAGTDVLGDMPEQADTRWALGRALIEALYMGGHPDEGSALVARMLDLARDEIERAELVDLELGLDIFHGRHLEAIAAGVDALARLGVTLPADPAPTEIAAGLARVELLLAGRDLVEIADLPEADDPRTVAALQLLMDTGPAAMFVRGRLAFAIFLAIVELSLARGATRATGYGVAGYGMFLACSLGLHIEAGILGHVALRLNQRVGDPALAAKIHQLVGGLILPWTRPIPTCIELLEQGTRLGVATGDLQSALYNATSVVLLHVARNASLFDVRRAAEGFLQSSGRMVAVHGSGVFHMALRLCRCLAGELPEPTPQTAARWLAEVWDAEPDPRTTALSLLYDNIFCTLVLTTFGCHAAVRPLAPQAAERLAALATPMAVDAFYLHALCRCLSLPQGAHAHDLADVETTHARLATWAAACPENFAARYALLTAELARVKGGELEAAEHYKKAIRTARKHGETGTEALACELAGRQCAADGDDVLSDMYFRTASEAYARWGATAKAQALQREHGLRPRRTVEPERAATGLADALDLRTLIKASRAISSEIQLDRLLRTLLGVVMENAGAARGLVVFAAEGRLTVEAEGSVDPPDIRVLQGTPLEQHPWIAQSVVQYVVRSHQDVLLARAAHEGDFRGDPYIAERQVQSIVCTPILHQSRCTGALYLEHATSDGVFTAARLELLKQLAAQLAVSVENARLYDDLSRARKEAIAAEKVKARFLMNMSHELRTPLNAVIGYAELMQENLALGLHDSFGDDLSRISRAARNLLRTLSGILELSKLAGGTSFVERAAVDVEGLIRELVAEHETAAAARGNVIETRGELHGPVVTDRSMLRYCLNSLIDNAIKFTLGGRIAVEAAREHDEGRAWLALRVRDTGIGIPESSYNAIFGAFTQVNDAASRSYEGAGVGLAVARQFSRLIGGDLTVASEVGRGSTFTLKIPVR